MSPRRFADVEREDATYHPHVRIQECRELSVSQGRACVIRGRAAFASACLALLPVSELAANLVVNGDFEAGNTGFETSYVLMTCYQGCGVESNGANRYGIDTDPQDLHPGWVSMGDHTTGGGNMMIVNGSPVTGPNGYVWRSPADFAIAPNTDYFFEAFVANVYNVNGAVLTFEVFNAATSSWDTLGNADLRGVPSGPWQGISFTWNSGSNTSTRLRLLNAQPAAGGNDFAIDDVYFDGVSSLTDADLSIEKSVNPATAPIGGGVTYTLVMNNNGPAAADGAIVTDPGAPNLDCTVLSCSAAGGAVCPISPTPAQLAAGLAIPTLPSGGAITLELDCTVEQSP